MTTPPPTQILDQMSLSEYDQLICSSPVYHVAQRTPLQFAPAISQRNNTKIYLKREDLQPIHSFKLRGAYNRMALLPPNQLHQGVVAASAGNHAQGVALSAQKLGTKATIVVPESTPEIKQSAIKSLGATLILHGDTYDDAYHHSQTLAKDQNRTYIHPYDHPHVIAGQGTIGLELAQELPPETDTIIVPVGGGGLLAGIALAIKSRHPHIRIIGVEAEDADAMNQSLKLNHRVTLPYVSVFADGCAVRQVGQETFRIAQQLVDEIIVVTNDEICAAVKEVYEDRRAIVEPAGALSVAGFTKLCHQNNPPKSAIAILSGANLNFDRLQFIAERTKTGSGTEAILAVTIPEQPGTFRKLSRAIGRRNLTEFNYRLGNPSQAIVFAGISVKDHQDAQLLKENLNQAGFTYSDLTQDETAKLHVRHMVGGRTPNNPHEQIFQALFPERPGALADFLDDLAGRWNISLFHYRNHGSDRGRALVGFQVPPQTQTDFNTFIQNQPFPLTNLTNSPSVQLFLNERNKNIKP